MSGNRQPAFVPRVTVQTEPEVRNLLEAADTRIFQIYRNVRNPRDRLAEALRANNESAREALRHRVGRSIQEIVEEFADFEFHIIESWNLTRLNYTESFPTTEDEPMQGRYDIFDHDNQFPLRWAVGRNGISLPPRQWLRYRRNRSLNIPSEHWAIRDNFFSGGPLREERSIFQERALEMFGIEIVGPNWRFLMQPNVWYHLIDPPEERIPAAAPPLQGDAHSQRQVRHPPPPVAEVQQQAFRAPSRPVPASPQPSHPRPPASSTRPAPAPAPHPQRPVPSVLPGVPSSSGAPNVGVPVQQALPPALPTVLAVPAPAAPNPPVLAQPATPRVQRQHIALFDAPSPNVPLPPGANFTLAEIMTFIPNHMRSVDMIDRVFSNTGKYHQKALSNIATSHRHHVVTENFIWKFIRGEMTKEYPAVIWDRNNKPHTHPVNRRYVLGGISVRGIRTLEQVSGRGSKPSYPRDPIPFSQLAHNVKHLPVGDNALDLTRCVDWVLRNPAVSAQYMYPTDYATVLGFVGGAYAVTNNHLDSAVIARFLGPIAKNRAERHDLQWEQECNQHRAAYWPQQPNAPAIGQNFIAQAAVPMPAIAGLNPALQVQLNVQALPGTAANHVPLAPLPILPVPGSSHGGQAPPTIPTGPSMNNGSMLPRFVPAPSSSGASNMLAGTAVPLPGPVSNAGPPPAVPQTSSSGASKHDCNDPQSDEDSYSADEDASPLHKRVRLQDPHSEQVGGKTYSVARSGLEQDWQGLLSQPYPANIQQSEKNHTYETDPYDNMNQRYGEPPRQSTQQAYMVDHIQGHSDQIRDTPGGYRGPAQPQPHRENPASMPSQPYYPSQQYGENSNGYGGNQQSQQTEELPQTQEIPGYFDYRPHECGYYPASGNDFGGYQQPQEVDLESQIDRHTEYQEYVEARPWSPSEGEQHGEGVTGHGGYLPTSQLPQSQVEPEEFLIDPELLQIDAAVASRARKRPRSSERKTAVLGSSSSKRPRLDLTVDESENASQT
ncbi:hypothetical protein PMIN06_005066 [Paraphaeosphaeria minitans]